MEIQVVEVVTEIRHRRNRFHFEVIDAAIGIQIEEDVCIGIETSNIPFHHKTAVFLPKDFAYQSFRTFGSEVPFAFLLVNSHFSKPIVFESTGVFAEIDFGFRL